MNDKDIDKLLKAEADLQSQSPPTHVWDDIEKLLTKKKPKRRFFWVFLFGALAIGSAAIWYNLYTDTLVENAATAQHTQNHSPVNKVSSEDDSSNKFINKQTSTEKTKTAPDEKVNSQINSVKESITPNKLPPSIQQQNQINTNATVEEINTSPDLSKENKEVEFPFIQREGSVLENKNTSTQVHQNKSQTSTTSVIALHQKDQLPVLAKLGYNDLLSPLPFRPFDPTPTLAQTIKEVDDEYTLKRHRIFLGGTIGVPAFTNTGDTKPASMAYSTDWYSWGIAANYSYNLTKQWSLYSGIQLNQSKRKFERVSEDRAILLRDINQPTQAEISYNRITNLGDQRYTAIDIPLGLRYELLLGNWGIAADIAGLMNVGFHTSGRGVDRFNQVATYTNENTIYKKSIGFGISPGLTFSRSIGSSSSLFFSPRYTTYTSSILENKSDDYRLSRWDIQLGMQWQF